MDHGARDRNRGFGGSLWRRGDHQRDVGAGKRDLDRPCRAGLGPRLPGAVHRRPGSDAGRLRGRARIRAHDDHSDLLLLRARRGPQFRRHEGQHDDACGHTPGHDRLHAARVRERADRGRSPTDQQDSVCRWQALGHHSQPVAIEFHGWRRFLGQLVSKARGPRAGRQPCVQRPAADRWRDRHLPGPAHFHERLSQRLHRRIPQQLLRPRARI